MFLTDKSESTCRKVIRTIKKTLGRKPHQVVSIREYCNYMGFDYQEVFNMINGIKEEPVKKLPKSMKKVG